MTGARDEEAAGSNPVTPTSWLLGSELRKRGQGPSASPRPRAQVGHKGAGREQVRPPRGGNLRGSDDSNLEVLT